MKEWELLLHIHVLHPSGGLWPTKNIPDVLVWEIWRSFHSRSLHISMQARFEVRQSSGTILGSFAAPKG